MIEQSQEALSMRFQEQLCRYRGFDITTNCDDGSNYVKQRSSRYTGSFRVTAILGGAYRGNWQEFLLPTFDSCGDAVTHALRVAKLSVDGILAD